MTAVTSQREGLENGDLVLLLGAPGCTRLSLHDIGKARLIVDISHACLDDILGHAVHIRPARSILPGNSDVHGYRRIHATAARDR